jgi:hypothetical protein
MVKGGCINKSTVFYTENSNKIIEKYDFIRVILRGFSDLSIKPRGFSRLYTGITRYSLTSSTK